MASNPARGGMTEQGILSFPTLFVPCAYQNGAGGKEWSCTLLIPKSDQATMKAVTQAIQIAFMEIYGKDQAKWNEVKAHAQFPIQDGDNAKYAAYEGFAGHWALRFKRGEFRKDGTPNDPPNIVDETATAVLNKAVIYAGVKARVKYFAYAYDNKGKQGSGVGLTLDGVQRLGDSKPFSTRGHGFTAVAAVPTSQGGFDDSNVDGGFFA